MSSIQIIDSKGTLGTQAFSHFLVTENEVRGFIFLAQSHTASSHQCQDSTQVSGLFLQKPLLSSSLLLLICLLLTLALLTWNFPPSTPPETPNIQWVHAKSGPYNDAVWLCVSPVLVAPLGTSGPLSSSFPHIRLLCVCWDNLSGALGDWTVSPNHSMHGVVPATWEPFNTWVVPDVHKWPQAHTVHTCTHTHVCSHMHTHLHSYRSNTAHTIDSEHTNAHMHTHRAYTAHTYMQVHTISSQCTHRHVCVRTHSASKLCHLFCSLALSEWLDEPESMWAPSHLKTTYETQFPCDGETVWHLQTSKPLTDIIKPALIVSWWLLTFSVCQPGGIKGWEKKRKRLCLPLGSLQLVKLRPWCKERLSILSVLMLQ